MEKNVILETGLLGKKAGTLNKVCIDKNRRPVSKMEISIVGFTLVELIVVITILAILGTIAIMAFGGYSKNARDSARISDISRITSSVELFQVAKGFFPEPTNSTNVTYSGATAWTQGTFGDSTVINVEKISKKPVDPLTGSEYAYSITQSKKEYEIGGIYEGDSIAQTKIIPQSYAAEAGNALVKGNYNGSILKVQSGSTTFVLAIPSILASDIETSADVLEIVSNQRLVFEKYGNLPASYKGTSYELNGGFGFEPGTGSIVVFSGDTSLLKDEGEQLSFVEKLQAVYGGTVIEGTPEIKNVLSYDATNDEEGTKLLAQVLISDYVDGSVPITAQGNTPVGGGQSQGNSPQSNIRLAHGRDFICIVLSSGSVKCWGENDNGQLGDGTIVNRYTPITVEGVTGAIEIAAGLDHTCVILTGGSMKCWGKNNYGQLGDGSIINKLTPVEVSIGISTATYVDAGENYTCVLLLDKTVRCWGRNNNGQLGDNTTINSLTPVDPGLANVKKIKVGSWNEHSTCVVLESGIGKCWGSNNYGQIGNGTSGGNITMPTDISVLLEGELLSDIDISNRSTCGVLTTGAIKCWGNNEYGQLGNNSTTDSITAVTVVGITNALSIGINTYHSCAILQGGTIKCWGRNNQGALGDGTTVSSNIPINTGITNAVRMAVGVYGVVVELADRKIMYFGENDDGQRGNGGLLSKAIPVSPVGLGTNVANILDNGVSIDFTLCFVMTDNTLKCSGGYSDIPWGVGILPKQIPTEISGFTGVQKVSISDYSGSAHGCIVTTTGGVKCWGENDSGQLGDTTNTDSWTLVDVDGLSSGVTDITVNWRQSCALLADKTVRCWGYNYGSTPVDVGLTDVDLFGLGRNLNDLYSVVLGEINGLTGVTDLHVGADHKCVIASGEVMCWGYNSQGQLGDGTTTNSTSNPVSTGIMNAVAIGGGGFTTCAIITGGTVKCWGAGTRGQIGNGLYVNKFAPDDVIGITNAVSLGGGGENNSYICAKLSDNSVKCWGFDSKSQLGDDAFQKTEVNLN